MESKKFTSEELAGYAADLERMAFQQQSILGAADAFRRISSLLGQLEQLELQVNNKRAQLAEIEASEKRAIDSIKVAEAEAQKRLVDADAQADAMINEARRNANEKVMEADKRVTALMGVYEERMAVLTKDHEENSANRAQQIKDQTEELDKLSRAIVIAKSDYSALLENISAAKKRALEDLGLDQAKADGGSVTIESSNFSIKE